MGIAAAVAAAPVASAIAGAGVASAAGAVASGAIEAGAAQSAANTQAQTAANAAAAQQAAGQQAVALDQANQQQAVSDLQPFANEGQTGLNELNQNLNFLTTPFDPTEQQLEATPGFTFTNQQGLLATQNAAAAQGLGVSGAALNAAANFSTGLANSTFATDAGINQTNQLQIGNLLTGIVDNGQNAATSQANLLQGFSGIEGGALTGQANESAQTQLAGAQAQAAGTIGAGNATSGAITGVANSLSQASILNALLQNNSAFGTVSGQQTATGATGFTPATSDH
jgi:hypothetical protein